MSQYTDVLVTTDGSDCAGDAAAHAVALADAHDATLHALYVVETRTGYDNAIVDPETVRVRLHEEGSEATAAIAERARTSGVDVVTAVAEGSPPDEILAYVAEHDVDVVVMGARGRSAFRTALLGSTTESVLARSDVPVLVVGRSDGRDDD
ncbi:universal stress protein [Haloplanus sp. GCM10025708]|uniref:universal stress protein n=1 Tax=Haloferacaceae TaxID=1644056 RepID=UPI0036151CB9